MGVSLQGDGKEKEMKSIMQDEKFCIVCGSMYVESHHCFMGSNRKISEKYGLKVWLCAEHHRGDYSPHHNREFDLKLKRQAQAEFLKTHSMELWMKDIGKIYGD